MVDASSCDGGHLIMRRPTPSQPLQTQGNTGPGPPCPSLSPLISFDSLPLIILACFPRSLHPRVAFSRTDILLSVSPLPPSSLTISLSFQSFFLPFSPPLTSVSLLLSHSPSPPSHSPAPRTEGAGGDFLNWRLVKPRGLTTS